MDEPLKSGAIGGVFSLDNGGDARCRLFERGLHGGLRNLTVLRVMNDARMKN